jgi:hypothetical protein
MHTTLLLLEIRRRRDALGARRHARQVAGLLGFDQREQTCVAALVFEMACRQLKETGALRLRFEIDQGRLLVFPAGAPGEGASAPLRVEKPLPAREPPVAPEDITCALRALNELAPGGVFEEVQRQNQEVLQLLVELQACQARLAELARKAAEPAAA